MAGLGRIGAGSSRSYTKFRNVSRIPKIIGTEVVFSTPGTYIWTVPVGVTSISVVAVGAGGGQTTAGGNSSFGTLCVAGGGNVVSGGTVITGSGAAGGDGGTGGGGGAGAGGYTTAGTNGQIGGNNSSHYKSGAGGGVGVYGIGYGRGKSIDSGRGASSGTLSSIGSSGDAGSQLYSTSTFGGGSGANSGNNSAGGGGALAYVNTITVTPGTTYTVTVGALGSGGGTPGTAGAVRIVWPGNTRFFPATNVGLMANYQITSNITSVNEGSAVTFTLVTKDVSSGTIVPYSITGITADDLISGSLTGNFIVGTTNTVSITLKADGITEGAETLVITIEPNGAKTSVIVNDTSKTLSEEEAVTGAVFTWGSNVDGELGNNTITRKSSPALTIAGGTNWKLLSSGRYHTAAIKPNGTLWTWGRNSSGQLGDNTTIRKSSPVQTIAGGNNWKLVSAGGYHTAAIKTDGTLWTWGSNGQGRLGDNSTVTRRVSPVQTIAGGTNWKQVSAGESFTAAIKTDGTLWTWGANFYGGLGDNTRTHRSSPVQTIAGGTNWKQVSSGRYHIAAVKTDGTLWTWGLNSLGQLGDSTTTHRSSPVQTIAGGTNWKQVSSGYSHMAAIKTDDTLWNWGLNSSGQLGDNTITSKSSPVQTVAGGTNWLSVSASGSLHTAAIKTDGTLWTWGLNSSGQLGDNTTINKSSPVQTVAAGTNWKQVSVGYSHTMAANDALLLGLTSSASEIIEGSPVQFTLIANENIADGSQVPYTITGIDSADLTAGSLTGNFILTQGTATSEFILTSDTVTEGTEYMLMTLDDTSITANVAVNELTYTLTSNIATVNEGSSVQFALTTTSVADGTLVPFTITGNNITANDFTQGLVAGLRSTSNYSTANSTGTITAYNGIQTIQRTYIATDSGTLTITWTASTNYSGSGRGISISSSNPPVSTTGNGTLWSMSSSGSGTAVYAISRGDTVTFNVYAAGPGGGITYQTTTFAANWTFASSTNTANTFNDAFIIAANTASTIFTIANDAVTEGTEILTMALTDRPEVTKSVTINDTSLNPTYTLTSNVSSVNEGDTVSFSLVTTDVVTGTAIPYTITGIQQSDLSQGYLTGNLTISNNNANVNLALISDSISSESETIIFTLNSEGTVASVPVIDSVVNIAQYSVSPSVTSVNEGNSVTFNITSTAPAGTRIPYTVTGIDYNDLQAFPQVDALQWNGSILNPENAFNNRYGTTTTVIRAVVGYGATFYCQAPSSTTGESHTITIMKSGVLDWSATLWPGFSKSTTGSIKGAGINWSASTNGTNTGGFGASNSGNIAVTAGQTITISARTTSGTTGTSGYFHVGMTLFPTDKVNTPITDSVISNGGTVSVQYTLANDLVTEGTETMTLTLDGMNKTANVTINDTSI